MKVLLSKIKLAFFHYNIAKTIPIFIYSPCGKCGKY
jgi:hypothetical protein